MRKKNEDVIREKLERLTEAEQIEWLREQLKGVVNVYMLAKKLYDRVEYFHRPCTKDELELVVNSPYSSDLQLMMHAMLRVVVVELSKLYKDSRNEHFCLSTLYFFLEGTDFFKKWKKRRDEKGCLIKKIVAWRDRRYGHYDSVFEDKEEYSFVELKSLLDLAEEFIRALYKTKLDTELFFPEFDRERFVLLKQLCKGEMQRKKELAEETLKEIEREHKILSGG